MLIGRQPVLIIGSHRSGTTMVTQFIDGNGVNMGARKEINAESLYFLRSHNKVLNKVGCSWDNPFPLDMLKRYDDLNNEIKNYFRKVLSSPMIIEHFMNSKIRHWGWKDPRTSLFINVWEDILIERGFKPVILRIVRNGVDVALSLSKRENEKILLNKKNRNHSLYVTDEMNSFNLWDFYMDKENAHWEELKSKKKIIRYEEILENPLEGLKEISGFLSLNIDRKRMSLEAERIDRNKKYGFKRKDYGVELYNKVLNNKNMKMFKYSNLL